MGSKFISGLSIAQCIVDFSNVETKLKVAVGMNASRTKIDRIELFLHSFVPVYITDDRVKIH